MEHRWSSRTSATGNVLVESSRVGKVRGKILDISLGGALVETGAITLPVHAPVTVAINFSPKDRETHDYRLCATVVRNFQTASGLMFQDLDQNTVRALGTMLSRTGEASPLRPEGISVLAA